MKSGQFITIALLACPVTFAQSPTVSAVVNLASGQSSLSPGVLAAVFGSNLDLAQPSTVPISVLLSYLPGFVLTRSPQQLTVQLPVEVQPGSAILQVGRQGLTSPAVQIQLQNYAPGIFTTTGTLGSIWHFDGTPVNLANPAKPGENLSLLAVGLGATNPSIRTGAPAPTTPVAVTATMPNVIVDGKNVTVQQAELEPSSIGKYRVFFTIPTTVPSGSHSLSLTIGGQSSNTVLLVTAGQGTPVINSILNAAGFTNGPVSPGSIVSILGINFGQQDNLALFPATTFQGFSLTFNSIPAPLFAVVPSAGQVNALVPSELPAFGIVNVQAIANNGSSAIFQIQMAPASPGIFRIHDPSGATPSNAAALLANTAWLVVPQSLASTLQIPQNCANGGINPASICGQAARAGDFIQIYATGLGKATIDGDPSAPGLPTGAAAPANGTPLYKVVDTPTVTIGGIPATVLFAGLAPGYAGLNQVNILVPTGVPVGDQTPLRISTTNGLSDTATIAIQP